MNAQPSPSNQLLTAALRYGDTLKWPVFPCRQGGKTPLTMKGVKDASADREQILAWWQEWPDASIGVAPGATSGITVLDVDVKPEEARGDLTLKALMDEHGSYPPRLARDVEWGTHHVFAYAPGVRNSPARSARV
jgi:hypothetical protein